jgi:hypothetical protein
MNGFELSNRKARRPMNKMKIEKFFFWFLLAFATGIIFPQNSSVMAAQSDWPLEITSPEGKIILYQPQPDTLKDDKLTGRSAVSITPEGTDTPLFGALWFEARISTDRDERTVTMHEIDIPQAKFPNGPSDLEKKTIQVLKSEIPKMNITFSLDRLLVTLEDAEKEHVAAENLKMDPPKIVFTTVPSVLVTIDGAPQLRPLPDTKVMSVVNTPFIILFDPEVKTYYLKGGDQWFAAEDVSGPWQSDIIPSESVRAIPLNETQKGESSVPKRPLFSKMERIIVATEPTEIIVANGEPKYTPIKGTDLLFMSNTTSDVFMDINSQEYYIVLTGRWYRSPSLNGPWVNVPADQLPPGFAQISPGSPKANVLTYVAGTRQAKEALLDSSIPQTAAINRTATINVTYDGAPKFENIEGTNLSYAVNSPFSVLEFEGKFYACHQAVWYTAENPLGPWTVAVEVPVEIYSIPPSSPLYNVKYVRVYRATPDVVYVGYLPGYLGWYGYGPTVVYGTGWYYPGCYGPYYYPHPWTWGFGFSYNSFVGWGFGFNYGYWGPGAWLGVGIGFGGYYGGWWGPRGYYPPVPVPYHRTAAVGYAFATGAAPSPHASGNNYYYRNNIYNSPGSVAQRAASGQAQGSPSMQAAQARQNNVFADRSGNIYRYSKNGWEQRNPSGWTQTQTRSEISSSARGPSSATADRPSSSQGRTYQGGGRGSSPNVTQGRSTPLDRDQFARQRGAERANSFQRFRGDPGGSGALRGSAGSGNFGTGNFNRGGGGSIPGGGGVGGGMGRGSGGVGGGMGRGGGGGHGRGR